MDTKSRRAWAQYEGGRTKANCSAEQYPPPPFYLTWPLRQRTSAGPGAGRGWRGDGRAASLDVLANIVLDRAGGKTKANNLHNLRQNFLIHAGNIREKRRCKDDDIRRRLTYLHSLRQANGERGSHPTDDDGENPRQGSACPRPPA